MGPFALFWGLATVFGLALMAAAGYLLVRGPFLGGELLPSDLVFVAIAGFVAGLIVTTLGGSTFVRLR